MRFVRLVALVAALVLVAAACGDDTATTTSSIATTTTTAASSTTVESTTTTTATPVAAGTIEDVLGMMMEDPLLGTGFHEMEWEGNFAWSTASIDGSPGELNRLAARDIEPTPAIMGLPPMSLLLDVWIQNVDSDIIPNGSAVFSLTEEGWAATHVVTSGMVFGFIETTTDYMVDPVEGPVQVGFTITSWDHAGGPSFEADVEVFDYFAGYTLAFAGSIVCTYGDPLDCELTSDDGVLRPGDEGEAVEALQEDLATLGYYTGPVDGDYGSGTQEAVRRFQEDHRLTRDGRAGPNTLQLIDDLISGAVTIVMAGPDGVGDLLFGTDDEAAYAELVSLFGAPDANTGWYVDACDGNDWLRATWDGFTAIFTDRDGFRAFDGWHVDDVTDLPTWLYFEYGIGPGTTWPYLQSIGSGWDPAYGGVWYQNTIGYNNGRLAPNPAYPGDPSNSAQVTSFGTGTGGFVSC